ncbi:hypothetical protein AXF42_Ash019869 [Apostasia shenzhenica]|uniref:Uncharacterized protein n=1 Tax=Apostasia shenzhenica TaxID=1088818 RepID=A0A2H9ZX23_9ASPA|nr:hypothetical protein AXF42_Ash019869 [Apostasia shenzhenica]
MLRLIANRNFFASNELRAGESRRRSFAARNKKLKHNGEEDVGVEELELDGGAEAEGCLDSADPFEDRTTFIDRRVSDLPDIAKQVDASTQLQGINRAGWWWRRSAAGDGRFRNGGRFSDDGWEGDGRFSDDGKRLQYEEIKYNERKAKGPIKHSVQRIVPFFSQE